ncbi:MAG TPA: YhjD/YihY/BrkB family envelope integrity protein [Candidatus Acidoferrum sp.]|nr:YhjD/YihY/BrkB family envelope integrity protein [Candidatus Acidoferrum sp.]
MASGSMSRWARIRAAADNFFHEKGIESEETFDRTRRHRIAHFWLLVCRSFVRNRCPVRASSLAYTTLLALVPLLAVGVSITTSMLQKQGEEPIKQLIDRLVAYAAPALDLKETTEAELTPGEKTGRAKVVEQINGFIKKIDTGKLGVTGVLALLFIAISLLRTIEATLNDIWGVEHGRPWLKSIIYYWAVITLGPLFLVAALVQTTAAQLPDVPFLSAVVFKSAPFVLLSLGFAAFYAFMPNTRVQLKAAFIGGIVGGCLWQLNNIFNVIYVSRAVSYTNLYGSLALFPLFLVGLYFSWLIMLFGAQVAYAFQNREAYIEERQAESVNQRGREFIAMRVMTLIADRFLRGEKPMNIVDISCALGAPSQLVSKLLSTFVQTGLLVEVADGQSTAYSPARPVNRITAHDVLCVLRAGQGHELATKEDAWRSEVRGEFEKIMAAERQAGAGITLEMLAQSRVEIARATA